MKHQHGTALVVALFIMSLVAIVATALTARVQIDLRRERLISETEALYQATTQVNLWAKSRLKQYAMTIKASPGKIPPVTLLPMTYPTMKTHSITVAGSLYDAQARFNLNNLTESSDLAQFINLLRAVDSTITPEQAATIAQNVKQWLTPAGDSINVADPYFSERPPYRTAHTQDDRPAAGHRGTALRRQEESERGGLGGGEGPRGGRTAGRSDQHPRRWPW